MKTFHKNTAKTSYLLLQGRCHQMGREEKYGLAATVGEVMPPRTPPLNSPSLCENLCEVSRRCRGSAAFLLADSPAYTLCRLLPRPLREKVSLLSHSVSEWESGHGNTRYGPKNTITDTAVQCRVRRLDSVHVVTENTHIHTALEHRSIRWCKHVHVTDLWIKLVSVCVSPEGVFAPLLELSFNWDIFD